MRHADGARAGEEVGGGGGGGCVHEDAAGDVWRGAEVFGGCCGGVVGVGSATAPVMVNVHAEVDALTPLFLLLFLLFLPHDHGIPVVT